MHSLFFIAKNNIRKHKGDALILFLLFLISGVLLFSSLTLLLTGNDVTKAATERNNTSDYLLWLTGKNDIDVEKVISEDPATKDYEIASFLTWSSKIHVNDDTENETSSEFFFVDASRPTRTNTFPSEFEDLKGNGILVPYYYSFSMKVGDIITIDINGTEMKFEIKGYVENFYFMNPMCISGYLCIVSHESYEKIDGLLPEDNSSQFMYANVKEGTDIDEYDSRIIHSLGEKASPVSVTRETIATAGTSLGDIVSSVILVFTLVLMVLAIIIMHFSIKNFIELNLQNFGILQANGYTAGALRFSCVTEQMIISITATLISIAIGIVVSRPLSSLQSMLIGLHGFEGICIPAVITTLIAVPLITFIGTLLSTRSIKKLSVLESLRSGITSHNFRKNRFALDRTHLPLNIALSGKHLLGRPGKTLLLMILVMMLSASTCLGFTIYENFAMNNDTLLMAIGTETGDFMITDKDDNDIKDEILKNSHVEKAVNYARLSSFDINYKDRTQNASIDVYDDPSLIENEMLIEGHLPANENEIVITKKVADEIGAKLGDKITVKSGEDFIPFTVCGIDQKINHFGLKGMLTDKGARRVLNDLEYQYTIAYLKEGTDLKAFEKEMKELFPNSEAMDSNEMMGSAVEGTNAAMTAICVIFVIVTCFIVILTEILLTRSHIIRERTELGVSKAIGYTSKELIRRIMQSYMPVIVIGALAGVALHILLSDRLLTATLSSFGLSSLEFSTQPYFYIISVGMIVICALVTSAISSRSIAKLEPVRILKEE
ncbi:MAG: FtsX-like permease family protein [Clostridiales bacterium]|nr:FtsX-like permease family protein [Clostridiales bacterium]